MFFIARSDSVCYNAVNNEMPSCYARQRTENRRCAAMQEDFFSVHGARAVSVEIDALEKITSSGNADAALLWLYCLKVGKPVSVQEASQALNMQENNVRNAIALLREMRLISYAAEADSPLRPEPQKRPDTTPEYTAADIKNAISCGGEFPRLVRETQKSLGRVLSSDDLIKLFGIYDNLGLPPEVILHLITYCIGEQHRKYGPEKNPTMRYIEKAAYTWERAGIFSLERAEEYIKRLEKKRDGVLLMQNAMGIKGRELSVTERRYIESWIDLGFGPEAAAIACDRTLVKTGKLAWGYMNSIMNSWASKGLHSPEEIARGDGRPGSAPSSVQKGGTHSSVPTDADYEEICKLLDDIKEGR